MVEDGIIQPAPPTIEGQQLENDGEMIASTKVGECERLRASRMYEKGSGTS